MYIGNNLPRNQQSNSIPACKAIVTLACRHMLSFSADTAPYSIAIPMHEQQNNTVNIFYNKIAYDGPTPLTNGICNFDWFCIQKLCLHMRNIAYNDVARMKYCL